MGFHYGSGTQGIFQERFKISNHSTSAFGLRNYFKDGVLDGRVGISFSFLACLTKIGSWFWAGKEDSWLPHLFSFYLSWDAQFVPALSFFFFFFSFLLRIHFFWDCITVVFILSNGVASIAKGHSDFWERFGIWSVWLVGCWCVLIERIRDCMALLYSRIALLWL